MGTCRHCGVTSRRIAAVLSFCARCIRARGARILPELQEIHVDTRRRFGLPASPPQDEQGLECGLCQNGCRVPQGQSGYCAVRRNKNGRLTGGTPQEAAVSWSYDPLPTNCVADWVCTEGSSAKPRIRPQNQVNLAVFYEACTFNCLFCQNWQYRKRSPHRTMRTADELARSVTPETACICHFGGDPTCQLPYALAASRLALKQHRHRALRICWETNGSMAPRLLHEMMDLSLESGGCVKFDLKAQDKFLHQALCGADNARTLENFAAAATRIRERPEPPPLVASTLLVPGYIDEQEVGKIAFFIAQLDPHTPYALLGFHGDFLMAEMPATSWREAQNCLTAAREAGLTRTRLGNLPILQ